MSKRKEKKAPCFSYTLFKVDVFLTLDDKFETQIFELVPHLQRRRARSHKNLNKPSPWCCFCLPNGLSDISQKFRYWHLLSFHHFCTNVVDPWGFPVLKSLMACFTSSAVGTCRDFSNDVNNKRIQTGLWRGMTSDFSAAHRTLACPSDFRVDRQTDRYQYQLFKVYIQNDQFFLCEVHIFLKQ